MTPEFIAAHRGLVDGPVPALRESGDPRIRAHFEGHSSARVAELLARLFAFDIARALPRERVYANPMEPVHLDTVFLLKRDRSDPLVLEALCLDKFTQWLLIGATPDGRREIAYNAYRTVDDEAERHCVAALEEAAREAGGPLYRVFLGRSDVPESPREEFELFRVLHRSAACYDCNTILQADPTVRSRQEAVGRTIELIARVVETTPRELRLTLADYRRFLGQG